MHAPRLVAIAAPIFCIMLAIYPYTRRLRSREARAHTHTHGGAETERQKNLSMFSGHRVHCRRKHTRFVQCDFFFQKKEKS